MTKTIAVANLKGGVAKSVLATSIACMAALDGTVTLVDADDHQATSWWSGRGTLPEGLTVLPARYAGGRAEWAKAISALRTQFVIIDVGGGQPEAVAVAMTMADLVIIPVPASAVDVKTAKDTLSILKEVRSRRKGRPPCLLVPSRIDRRRAAGREIEGALHLLKEPVAPAIMERAAVAEAFGEGQWIGSYAPRSAGHQEMLSLGAVIKGALQ
jgi:chromosome partitioning protein